ncbi:MAG: hypothetical protein ACLQPD_03025 [Desulfomonilaceae bacterium]
MGKKKLHTQDSMPEVSDQDVKEACDALEAGLKLAVIGTVIEEIKTAVSTDSDADQELISEMTKLYADDASTWFDRTFSDARSKRPDLVPALYEAALFLVAFIKAVRTMMLPDIERKMASISRARKTLNDARDLGIKGVLTAQVKHPDGAKILTIK